MRYVCCDCGTSHAIEPGRWKCGCGGLLSLQYDKSKPDFYRLRNAAGRSLWKYIQALPFEQGEDCWRAASMGEGGTPLFALDPGNSNVLVKAEYYAPTLSFKDRGAAVLMAMAKKLGVKNAVADSSGNAGTAIAAYGARVGIQCDIFVPQSASDKKIAQIAAHNANVHKIPGSREDTATAAIKMLDSGGAFYASHVFNPFFYEGTKTYFYEVFEQLGCKFPDWFVIPVGNGTLLLGAHIAFKELMEWGYIEKAPKILAVQAKNCSPLEQAFRNGGTAVKICPCTETMAEGIAIAAPARGAQILQAIRETDGDLIAVDEESIAAARIKMARRGVYVEITSAANYAAYEAYAKKNEEFSRQTTVLPLCGAGLKSHA